MTTSTTAVKNLALYHYDTCPYCAKTRFEISRLGLDIELRNIKRQAQHRTALLNGGGKAQVPCLRIEKANGETQWLYESGDIIKYLNAEQQQLAS